MPHSLLSCDFPLVTLAASATLHIGIYTNFPLGLLRDKVCYLQLLP